MIKHMFVFGVLVPTLITVVVFVGFLICWFKFNIRERVTKSRFFIKHFAKRMPTIGEAAAHGSVLFSRECPGQDRPWRDRDGPGDAGRATLRDPARARLEDGKDRPPGYDWAAAADEDGDASVISADGSEILVRRSGSNAPERRCPNDDDGRLGAAAAAAAPPACRRGFPGIPTPGQSRAAAAVRTDAGFARTPDGGHVTGGRVPQTFRFPAIDGRPVRPSDAERHMKGVQMSADEPEATDYAHFIPIDEVERERALRANTPGDRRPKATIPASCKATGDRNALGLRNLAAADCPTGPVAPASRRPAETPDTAERNRLKKPTGDVTLRLDISPALIPTI